MRSTFNISDDCRKRLDVLRGFALVTGNHVTYQDIIERSIDLLFEQAYNNYIANADGNDMVAESMRKLLPHESETSIDENRMQ